MERLTGFFKATDLVLARVEAKPMCSDSKSNVSLYRNKNSPPISPIPTSTEALADPANIVTLTMKPILRA